MWWSVSAKAQNSASSNANISFFINDGIAQLPSGMPLFSARLWEEVRRLSPHVDLFVIFVTWLNRSKFFLFLRELLINEKNWSRDHDICSQLLLQAAHICNHGKYRLCSARQSVNQMWLQNLGLIFACMFRHLWLHWQSNNADNYFLQVKIFLFCFIIAVIEVSYMLFPYNVICLTFSTHIFVNAFSCCSCKKMLLPSKGNRNKFVGKVVKKFDSSTDFKWLSDGIVFIY